MRQAFSQAVSLGTTCQTSFQIRRQFGALARTSGIFDQQITPVRAVLEYFHRDFRGMLEKDDLQEEGNTVVNVRFGTKHPHEFPHGIRQSYENARSRHDYLCNKLRSVLDGDRSTLFVLANTARANCVADEIRELIRKRNPRLQFDMIDLVTKEEPTRPEFYWQGNDVEWAVTFKSYRINPHSYVKRQLVRFANHLISSTR